MLVSVCSPTSGIPKMLRKSHFSFFLVATLLITPIFSGCGGTKVFADTPTQSEPAAAPTGQQFIRTVKRGESVPSVLRSYISKTSYMTVAELEAAFREANHKPQGVTLKPEEQV